MELTRATTNSRHQALPTGAANDAMLTLVFRIGSQHYGLPVSFVIEIVRLPSLITLAGAPAAVIGLLNLRGRYVPVLDGSILIGEEPIYDLSNQIVIAGRIDEKHILPLLGLRVDQVIDVRTLHLNYVTGLNDTLAAPFLQGVIKADEDTVLLFDMEALCTMVPEGTTTHSDTSQNMMRP